MPMDVGRKIFHLRRERNWNQGQLGGKLGILGKEVSRIERGHRQLSPELQERLVVIFGITWDYLMNPGKDYYPPHNGDLVSEKPPGAIRLTPMESVGEAVYDIPLVGYVSAGETEIAYGDAGYPAGAGLEMFRRPHGVNDPHAYALIVKGDSMTPFLPEGSIVIAVTDRPAKEGDIVVCRERLHGKVYIKELRRLDDIVILESYNRQDHDPLTFNRKDLYFIHPCPWFNRVTKRWDS